MKTVAVIFLSVVLFVSAGCGPKKDPRIHVREGVASDTLVSNIVTKPIAAAFSALIGEGIEITNATIARNKIGLMQLNITGFNNSYSTKRFRYRVEWLDETGAVIPTKTSVWLPASAMGKSPFNITAVAPTEKAINFRMDTRK